MDPLLQTCSYTDAQKVRQSKVKLLWNSADGVLKCPSLRVPPGFPLAHREGERCAVSGLGRTGESWGGKWPAAKTPRPPSAPPRTWEPQGPGSRAYRGPCKPSVLAPLLRGRAEGQPCDTHGHGASSGAPLSAVGCEPRDGPSLASLWQQTCTWPSEHLVLPDHTNGLQFCFRWDLALVIAIIRYVLCQTLVEMDRLQWAKSWFWILVLHLEGEWPVVRSWDFSTLSVILCEMGRECLHQRVVWALTGWGLLGFETVPMQNRPLVSGSCY